MANLASFRVDSRAINDGVWVRVNPALYDDLEIRTRGFTDEFVDAQNARVAKARRDLNLDATQDVPNATMRGINASLLADFLVLGVRNLRDGDGDVTVQRFHQLLADPDYAKLARACWVAAGRVSTQTAELVNAAAGNSEHASDTSSNGQTTAS